MAEREVKKDRVLVPIGYTISEEYWEDDESYYFVSFDKPELNDVFYSDGFRTAEGAEAFVFTTFGIKA